MSRKILALLLVLVGVFPVCTSHAQQGKMYSIGIVREGGPDYAAIEGLKEGLKELGLVEGRDRSQADLIIETMRAKRVPTMFSFTSIAERGALAGYGVSFREGGRSSARYLQKILAGTDPRDMPVESVSRVELPLNINTARDIGVTVPQAVRLSASEIIE